MKKSPPQNPSRGDLESTERLRRGRKRYAERAWADACNLLLEADAVAPLESPDLERLAWGAALAGRDDVMLGALDRLYQAHLEENRDDLAARCAFWSAFRWMMLGEVGRAGGWVQRAQHLLERQSESCAEHGYMSILAFHKELVAGDFQRAHDVASRAAAIADQHEEADLGAFARTLQASALAKQAQVRDALDLLDEVLVATSSDRLSPLMRGLVFCSAIATCQQTHAVERAREWTTAFTDWCRSQPQLGAFSGICLVHRAEVLQLEGAWNESFREARRASEALSPKADPQALSDALYQQAEIHRLRGELEEAEEGYRRASQLGRDPQPGLALLRLAQGRSDAAANAMHRALLAAKDPTHTIRLLPAYVEVMLANGRIDEARDASRKLEALAADLDTDVVSAMAGHAAGAVRFAEGDGSSAIEPLRRAFRTWQKVGVPYLAARARLLLGRAFLCLGDRDGAALELEAAREVFQSLGAAPDTAEVDAISVTGAVQRSDAPCLTPRELEVLRLVARGKTNKAIAAELRLSEKTVEHHVSHILTKLDVPTRAAATAYGYEHNLI